MACIKGVVVEEEPGRSGKLLRLVNHKIVDADIYADVCDLFRSPGESLLQLTNKGLRLLTVEAL